MEASGHSNPLHQAASGASVNLDLGYGQQPFQTFQTRVSPLCKALWPKLSEEAFQTEHMSGGIYNQIFGVTVHPSQKKWSPRWVIQLLMRKLRFPNYWFQKDPSRLILRTPRDPSTQIAYDIAAFRYAAARSNLPVPKILSFDITGENALGKPYSLQKRLPGRCLADAWDDFNLTQCQRWSEWEVAARDESEPLWDDLQRVVQEMCDVGLFENEGFYFCHMDIHARNILVQIQDSSTVAISGIVDWDSGIFGPKFLSCKPPMWLWLTGDAYGDGEDDTIAEEEPQNPEARTLKEVFEDTIGREFLRFAYMPEYILARRLIVMATRGVFQSSDFVDILNIIRDWILLQPALGRSDSDMDYDEAGNEDASVTEE